MERKAGNGPHSPGDGLKYILVPVDFTDESFHALRYAHEIAVHLGMGMTLVHIHQPILDPVTGSAYDVEMMQRNRERLASMLTRFQNEKHHHQVLVPVDSIFDVGDIQSRLFELASADKYEMMVMSTLAVNTFLRRILGTVSAHVSRHSPVPVIIVPLGAPVKVPEYIVVGISDELFRDNAIEYLWYLAADSDMVLDFVHIGNDLVEFNRLKEALTEKIQAGALGKVNYTINRVSVGDEFIDQELTDYVNIKRADLVVLTTHYRSLIESIGHRSITKKMLLDPALPVMILHGEREGGLGLTNTLYDIIKEG